MTLFKLYISLQEFEQTVRNSCTILHF